MNHQVWVLVLLGLCAAGCPPPDCVYGEQRDPLTGACFLRCPDAELKKDALPLPQEKSSISLRAIHGVRQGRGESLTVYVVGESGVVLRWRGEQWEIISPRSTATWNGVWAARPDDVWVAGTGGNLWRRVEATWEDKTTEMNPFKIPLLSISGSVGADQRVTMLVGGMGGWGIWQGGTWAPKVDTNRDYWGVHVHGQEQWLMGKVWAESFVVRPGVDEWKGPAGRLPGLDIAWALLRVADQTWVIGNGQNPVLRLDQTSWVPEAVPMRFWAYGIAGRHERDIWVVGENGTILRGDAGAARPEDRWIQVPSPTGDAALRAVWVDSQGCGVWIVGDKGTVLRAY